MKLKLIVLCVYYLCSRAPANNRSGKVQYFYVVLFDLTVVSEC